MDSEAPTLPEAHAPRLRRTSVIASSLRGRAACSSSVGYIRGHRHVLNTCLGRVTRGAMSQEPKSSSLCYFAPRRRVATRGAAPRALLRVASARSADWVFERGGAGRRGCQCRPTAASRRRKSAAANAAGKARAAPTPAGPSPERQAAAGGWNISRMSANGRFYRRYGSALPGRTTCKRRRGGCRARKPPSSVALSSRLYCWKTNSKGPPSGFGRYAPQTEPAVRLCNHVSLVVILSRTARDGQRAPMELCRACCNAGTPLPSGLTIRLQAACR